METQVPPPADHSTLRDDSKSDAGASYAHAVLNFKQQAAMNNNKENISEKLPESEPQPVETVFQPQQEAVKTNNNIDDEESFTPVVSHSRKERKNEKRRKHLVNGAADKHEKSDRKEVYPPKDKSKETHQKAKLDEPVKDDKSEEQAAAKKVFVAAPIPKVNPWQVKQSIQNVVKEPKSQRVLQPKKQEVITNGPTTVPEVAPAVQAQIPPPPIVKAPRDKKRYNQKVSDIVDLL